MGSSETHSDAGTARFRSVRVFWTKAKSVILPSFRAGKSAYSAAESGVLINVSSMGRRVTILEPLSISHEYGRGALWKKLMPDDGFKDTALSTALTSDDDDAGSLKSSF